MCVDYLCVGFKVHCSSFKFHRIITARLRTTLKATVSDGFDYEGRFTQRCAYLD